MSRVWDILSGKFGFGSEQIQSSFDDVSLKLDVETPKSFQQFVNHVLRKMSEKLFHDTRGLQAEGSQREHSSMSDEHDIARDTSSLSCVCGKTESL